MSKSYRTVAALLLLAIGAGLGYYAAGSSGPRREPPKPLTPEELQRASELEGDLRSVLLQTNRFARATALASRLATAGPDAVGPVSDLLHQEAIGLDVTEALLLASFWAQYEPEAAHRWAGREADIGIQQTARATVIEVWAESDPKAAAEAVVKMGPQLGLTDRAVADALVRGWFASGLPGLVDHLRASDPGIEQLRALSTLSREWIRRDGVDGLIGWLDSLPDDDAKFKNAAFHRAASEITRTDLKRALEWCKDTCDGPYGENIPARIANEWAALDGAAAMNWISSFPPGDSRDAAVRDAFATWRISRPAELMRWIDAMGPEKVEPWFHPAVDRVAMWKSWDYPLEALAWAALLPDEARRELTFISILRRWREADEDAAEAWIEKSPLSEEARAKAREFPPKWQGRVNRPYPPEPGVLPPD
jgi:hypothetical protein